MPLPHRKDHITIKGARTHNLRHVDAAFPHQKLITITGRSGSGKSSLAFDTLLAEGQLLYLETLNTYVRQFLQKIERPPVEDIQGLLPTIGMQQKTKSSNPRARIATTADLYSHLKLLYARIGTIYSPISHTPVKRHTVEDVVDYILAQKEGTQLLILAPITPRAQIPWKEQLTTELHKGFTRLRWNGTIHFIEALLQAPPPKKNDELHIVIDRIQVKPHEKYQGRLADSVQTAFFEGQGTCHIHLHKQETREFSDRLHADGMHFESPSLEFFNFNNSYGACPKCRGWGKFPDIDPKKVIPNPQLTLRQGAILPWESPTMKKWKEDFLAYATTHDFPIDTPYQRLTRTQKEILWKGNKKKDLPTISRFFDHIESKIHKVSYRVLQARYRTFLECTPCRGTGLRSDAHYVQIGGKSLLDLLNMSIDRLALFFQKLTLPPHHKKVAHRLLEGICKKLDYLQRVGLGYLLPKRRTSTLSGGEYQRLRLGRLLGNPFIGSLYILDEPTVGLHPQDTENLIKVLCDLQKLGNTLIVVEHEEALMRASDHIIDMGPRAGNQGGQIVFQGSWEAFTQDTRSETAAYLTGKKTIPIPPKRPPSKGKITFSGIHVHNLQHLTASFPLHLFTAVTGVSGSGKSTLIEKVLYPGICRHLHIHTPEEQHYQTCSGNIDAIHEVEYFSQTPPAKSSRSNIATYLNVYEPIRKLYARQPLAVKRGYSPHLFSFNMSGGRCETCMGEGKVTIDMHFMADLTTTCEECQGKRFQPHILDIKYQDKHIADVLHLTVDDGLIFFQDHPLIAARLRPVQDVGLGYLKIGQPSNHFSGGEAQRVKLSTYLVPKAKNRPTLFIFDEPTTGLHFHDIEQLLTTFQHLVEQGHTVIVIEHNIELLKCADWIIDLGPGAADKGGKITFSGPPEEFIHRSHLPTARHLKPKMDAALPRF